MFYHLISPSLAVEYFKFIKSAYLNTDNDVTIDTTIVTSFWGVKFYFLPVTRFAPPELFTVNMTVGVPWTFTVVWDSAGFNDTQHWPCQKSFFMPWDPCKCAITRRRGKYHI